MRRGDQYIVGEGDDILARENAIHSDIDMRLDYVEDQLDAAKDGNRVDLDLLIKRYNDTVAELALRVEDLLNLAKSSISASIITETSTRQFLTPTRREAILAELRGDVIESANTLGELYNLIQGYATPTDVAEAIAAVTDNAPAGRDTFGKLSTALDAVAAKVAAITAGVEASRDTLKEMSDAVDSAAQVAATSTNRLNTLFAGAPASRDTLLELSNAIDTVATAVAAVTAGASASRDTLKEVSDAVDAVAASVAAITAGSAASRDTLKEVSDAVDALTATVAALTAGASASRDTFAEVGTALDTLTTALGLRLRVDAAQTLTAAQKDQAVLNLGLVDRYVRADGANSAQFGNRNRFVNGAFEVWQRGTSFPAANNNNRYLCDMVQCIMNGAGATMQFDRIVDTDGKIKMRAQTSGVPTDATLNVLKFYCEGGSTFAGKRVAISFNLRKFGAGSNLPMPNPVALRQNFGSGGTPSPQVVCSLVSFPADQTFTAGDTRFTYIFDVPSVTDKTFGTNGDDHLNWNVYLPINQAFKVMISEMQIEEVGTLGVAVPAPFERRTPADYLAMCQRYYEKSYSPDEAPGTLTFNGALTQRAQAVTSLLSFGSTRFASVKRAVPAVTLYNPTTGTTAAPVRNTTANVDLAAAVAAIGAGGFTANVNAAVAAGDGVQTHWTADASY